MNLKIAVIDKQDKICRGLTYLQEKPQESTAELFLIVEEDTDCLYKKYDAGTWSEERYPPVEPVLVDEVAETLQSRLNIEYRLSMLELSQSTTP